MASPIRDKIRSADILSSFWQCLYICIACTRRCTADSIANCNNSCSRCRQKKKTESYNCAPQRPLRPSPYHLLDGNTHRVSNHCLEKNKRKKHITRTRICSHIILKHWFFTPVHRCGCVCQVAVARWFFWRVKGVVCDLHCLCWSAIVHCHRKGRPYCT